MFGGSRNDAPSAGAQYYEMLDDPYEKAMNDYEDANILKHGSVDPIAEFSDDLIYSQDHKYYEEEENENENDAQQHNTDDEFDASKNDIEKSSTNTNTSQPQDLIGRRKEISQVTFNSL